MRAVTNFFALAAPLLASAAPLYSRQPAPADILVMKFARVLEDLESEFYSKVIAKFGAEDILAAGYTSPDVAVEQLLTIQRDEAAHQTALGAALEAFGEEPVKGCTFNLDPFLVDVATAMTAARLVENTGTSAYLGATTLIEDKRILLSAGSILTIEGRHDSMLNILNGGHAVPQPFDIPLSPEQVLAIAGPLISGCDLGIKPNPPLGVKADRDIGPGAILTFTAPEIDAARAAGQELFCQMIVGGAAMAIVKPIDACEVPDGILGPVVLFITSNMHPLLASNIVDQDKSGILVGPTMAFVDFGTPMETIARLVLNPDSPLAKDLNGTAPVSSDDTSTITPDEASSSIEAAKSSTTSVESSTGATSPVTTEPAPVETQVNDAPVVSTQVYQGDIVPKMPEAPAPTPAAQTVDPYSIPAPTDAGAGSAGVEPPTETSTVSGDIVAIVPSA